MTQLPLFAASTVVLDAPGDALDDDASAAFPDVGTPRSADATSAEGVVVKVGRDGIPARSAAAARACPTAVDHADALAAARDGSTVDHGARLPLASEGGAAWAAEVEGGVDAGSSSTGAADGSGGSSDRVPPDGASSNGEALSAAAVGGRRVRRVASLRQEEILIRARAGEAIVDADERRYLKTHHRCRLRIQGKYMDELLRYADIRLLASDPGEGIALAELDAREEVYHRMAQAIDERSDAMAVLRLRRIMRIVTPRVPIRPPANVIAAARRHMGVNPTFIDFTRYLCPDRMATVLQAEHKAEFGGHKRFVTDHDVDDATASLLARAPADLAAYLRSRGFGLVRPVPAALSAQLLKCKDDTIFGLGLLRLDILLRQSESRHVYHQMLVVKQIANTTRPGELSTIDGMDRFANDYCIAGTRLPEDPRSRRLAVGRFLLESHVELDREIRAAEPDHVPLLRRHLLPLPRMPHDYVATLQKLQRRQIAQGRTKRKDRVEPLAENMPEYRFLAGSRTAEVVHDERCLATAVREAERLDCTVGVDVEASFLAPIYDEDGRRVPGEQRRFYRIRNTNQLEQELYAVNGDADGAKRLPGGSLHKSRYDTQWWITYERTESVDGSVPRDPWIRPLIDGLVLFSGRGIPPEIVERQLAAAEALGLDSDIASRLPKVVSWYDEQANKAARRFIVGLGLRPWPMTSLCHGLLVANAGMRVMSNSGARTSEFFQITQDPSRFYKLENLPGGETRFVFMAIPKGFDEPMPFVILEDDTKAVMAAAAFASARFHGGGALPVTRPPCSLKRKCSDNRFAMNAGDLPLETQDLNPLVQLLFAGRLEIESYDLRHAFASYADGAGIPLRIIGAWLNQKTLAITSYYAKAPKAAQNRWRMQFHSVVNMREMKAAGAALMDAEKAAALEKVGALTSVAGGTCVSLAECPVRFACIGCRSSAVDPDKREEVEGSRTAAVALREVWARAGRVKSVEEQEATIERHDAALRQMDLIERYRALRDEEVEPGLLVVPRSDRAA